MSRKSFQTPQSRRSMLGFGSAAAKVRQQKGSEQKRLVFSNNKPNATASFSGRKRWSNQGVAGGPMKDPRPISNRNYQRKMIEEIFEFLNDSGYSHPISTKALTSPTSREFVCIFEHLYGFLNPNFVLNKKFEEQVPVLMKNLGYPFPIAKSSMFSIGSLHNWPPLLACLQWMVELVKVDSRINLDEIVFPLFGLTEEERSMKLIDKILLDYHSESYADYLEGKPYSKEKEDAVLAACVETVKCSNEDYLSLQKGNAALREELDILEAKPDIYEEALKEKQALEEGMRTDQMCIESLQQKLLTNKETLLRLQEQVIAEGLDSSVEELGNRARQEELKVRSGEVKHELAKLNAEKEQLENRNNDREMRYSKMYDETTTIVNRYNSLAEELLFLPYVKKMLNGESITLQFNHQPTDLSTSNEYKHRIKPLLLQLQASVREELSRIESAKITQQEKLDTLTDSNKEKEFVLMELQAELSSLQMDDDIIESKDKEYIRKMDSIRERERNLKEEKKKLDSLLAEAEEELMKKGNDMATATLKRTADEHEMVEMLDEYCETLMRHRSNVEADFRKIGDAFDEENDRLQCEIARYEESDGKK